MSVQGTVAMATRIHARMNVKTMLEALHVDVLQATTVCLKGNHLFHIISLN